MMTLLRLGLLTAAVSLSSCVVTTAPEPSDFTLSHAELTRKFPAARKTGTVRLYAQSIATTRDAWGRETHQATGGSLLVKESHPPIFAEATSISVTPEFSEVAGRSTVKRNDRLFIGQDESAAIRIDGTEVIPRGAVRTRKVAPQAAALQPPAPALATTGPITAPVQAEAPATTPPPVQPKPRRPKPKTSSKPRPKAASSASASTRSSAKPAASRAETTPPPAKPAADPNPPATDKSRLLNLMREPTDR